MQGGLAGWRLSSSSSSCPFKLKFLLKKSEKRGGKEGGVGDGNLLGPPPLCLPPLLSRSHHVCLEISLALSLCHCERRHRQSRCILARWPRLLEPMGICIHTWRRPMVRRERARLPRHQANRADRGDLSPEGSGIGSAGQEGCSLINDGRRILAEHSWLAHG